MHRTGALRRTALSAASCGQRAAPPLRWTRHASSGPSWATARNKGPRGGWGTGLVPVMVVSACAGWYLYPGYVEGTDSATKPKEDTAVKQSEKQRLKEATLVEEDRALLSAQHVQVEKSWENPGVYAWGSNSGRAVAPDSSEAVIKTPRRIPFFDGMLLRDLKIDRDFGVAVTEDGDIVQWGNAFAPDTQVPVKTLTGKDITKVAVSSDRIIALSRGGAVFSFPIAKSDQQEAGQKPPSSSWIPFWSGGASDSINYRILTPPSLGWREKVADVSSGLEHCLLLTSSGRVFSAASSMVGFPSKGQLGIPGLTWQTKPEGPYDQPSLVKGLPPIKQIATGNYHSLALSGKSPQVHAWGDNSAGQLGYELDLENPGTDAPKAIPLEKLYGANGGAGPALSVGSVAAGGSNSYFTVNLAKPATQDTWACGEGLYGNLGTGKWVHLTSVPAKIKSLSGLSEYNDATRSMVPIGVRHLSVGSTHAAAVLDNATSVQARAPSGSTNWGSDIVLWGGNEFYQLGTGKRNNLNEPAHIAPLDVGSGNNNARAAAVVSGNAGRLQLTPRATVRIGEGGKGRKISLEQRIECGRFATAVYSATA
ncbi:hypothetical protein GGTG_05770 [Gaeumannomyces tritici R3-111a-1]|uniref:Mitochondrial protein Fmp25 n=1 Tax=Gaeumannomyces tritici (strain R3-111a-1) TaxID=644352 RepID=J3NWV9_GAET3|nr:hypothetical protein GGTG_05770 [Gaeumannomyces tritici R3-111a-1]EJT75841.1 hypothetical protein GGTG_05770 [Gaeumannomyces tritici R3-111a-1]